jgi:hypothetical protein
MSGSSLLPLFLLNVTGSSNCQSGVWQWASGIFTQEFCCNVPFRAGWCVQAWHDGSLPFPFGHPLRFRHRSQPRLRPPVALARAIPSRPNLTRLFFPAKNSCDQTSDLEIVKEEDAPLRPFVRQTHNPVSVTSFSSFLQSLPHHNNL